MERVWLYRMCVQKHHKMHDRSKPATTTTMKRSEKKIEYPDPSKKSNLLQYLTILEIEHNNTQTIKDLTKLLPKHWRKALPNDWQSKFPPPSATKPHRTRSGSSNITPTHTLSEGNAESSTTGEASPEHPGEEIESSAVTSRQPKKMRSVPTISDVTTEPDRESDLRNLQGDADLVTQEEPEKSEVNESLREMQGDENVVIQENAVEGKGKDTQPPDTEHRMSADKINAENNEEEPTEPDVNESLREMQGDEDIVMEENEAPPEHPGKEIKHSAVHKPTVSPKQSRKMRSAPTFSDVTTEPDRETGLRNLQRDADLVTQEKTEEPEVNESLREMQDDENVVTQENEVDS